MKLGLRQEGGFVGEHDRDTQMTLPDHISARPEDLPLLTEGMIAFNHEPAQKLDPVIAASVTVTVETRGKFNHVSVASMLIPTNDAFFTLNVIKGASGKKTVVVMASAWDAGSEPNDELCANIPGPVCGGAGGSPGAGGEGFVHIHAGIHGMGDLDPAERDWRNPVARITISRTR